MRNSASRARGQGGRRRARLLPGRRRYGAQLHAALQPGPTRSWPGCRHLAEASGPQGHLRRKTLVMRVGPHRNDGTVNGRGCPRVSRPRGLGPKLLLGQPQPAEPSLQADQAQKEFHSCLPHAPNTENVLAVKEAWKTSLQAAQRSLPGASETPDNRFSASPSSTPRRAGACVSPRRPS